MSKKFGKILFLSAAAASVAAAALYFVRKREAALDEPIEDDYDDFSIDDEEDSDVPANYVPLNSDAPEGTPADSAENPPVESAPAENAAPESNSFTPLAEQVAKAAETAEESEEFFDEEDGSEEEPPISES